MKVIVLWAAISAASAFSPAGGLRALAPARARRLESPRSMKRVVRMESDMIDRLTVESSNPFRKVRLFIYGGFAFSAGVGGLTALTQLAASVTGQPDALPISQACLNIAVDFGVVGACAFGFNVESKAEKVAEQAQAAQAKTTKAAPLSSEDVAMRREQLSALPLELNGEQGTVEEIQRKTGRPLVVFAGSKGIVRDVLTETRVIGNVLKAADLALVPVTLGERRNRTDKRKGFGAPTDTTSRFESFSFVAIPPPGDDQWQDFMETELATAERQGNEAPRRDGLVLVVNAEGEVVRRGVGKPPWKQLIETLSLNS